MHFVELVAILAVIQFLFFGFRAGQARAQSGLKAPAVTGHDGFERAHRVQTNTLELLIAFLPSLFIAAHHWPPLLVSALGAVYLVGRALYARAYVADPSSRGRGFMVSFAPIATLAIMAFLGILGALTGITG